METCIFCQIAQGEAQQDVFHLHFHIVPRHAGDGQNIRWKSHPEYRERFDALLEQIGEIEWWTYCSLDHVV